MTVSQTSDILTRKESASFLRICITSFDRLKLPCIRLGRRVFYRRATLETWLISQEQIKGGKL